MNRKETKQLILDYKEVFESFAGERVLADLRKLSHLMINAPCKDNLGRLDPWMEIRKDGQKSVLVHIYKMLNKDPNEEKQERTINA